MTQKIECQFYWQRNHRNNAPVILAIVRAVNAGYRTRDDLLAVLPQFSVRRLALALDALFTADMLENNFGALSVHPDMNLLIEMVKKPLFLPISLEEARANGAGMKRALFAKCGCTNAAGAQLLVNIHFDEVSEDATAE